MTVALDVNYNVRQVDLPFWEQLRPAPAVSTAISCSCMPDCPGFNPLFGRYIYYLIAAAGFYRYDTWTDTYVQLFSPPIIPATWSSMRFSGTQCVAGNPLGASGNTITIPAYAGKTLKGFEIKIEQGTGMGQKRMITDVADPVVADYGIVTTVANALGGITLTDSTKAWNFNQWVGYQVRITYGAGVGQVRKILSNTATVLTLADLTISALHNFYNPSIFAPVPVASGTGVGSVYQIESSVVTVDKAWNPVPGQDSIYKVEAGTIMLYSSAAATPFYTVQQYDIATDIWYIRTATTLNFTAVGTDGTVERTSENASIWEKGIATGGTGLTLIDATKNWPVNKWAGEYMRITSGTGEDEVRLIVSNTSNTLTWATGSPATSPAAISPDVTSYYQIEGFDGGQASSGGASTITDSSKNWAVNRWKNYAVKIVAGAGKGQIIPIASNTATALTVLWPWTVQPDSSTWYSIQGDPDKNYLMLGGNAPTLIHNLDIDVPSWGRLADQGVNRNASVQFGANRAVAIASATNVGSNATITTASAHQFRAGQIVTIKGMFDSKFNITTTIASVPAATTFVVPLSGVPSNLLPLYVSSGTTLVDATKNWGTNQWAGYMCYMTSTAVTAASGLATGQAMQIASNTATVLTFVGSATATPPNGICRYVICPRAPIGVLMHGIATGGSGTTLQDTAVVGTFTGQQAGNLLTVTGVTNGVLFVGYSVTGAGIPTGTVITAFGTGTGGTGTYYVNTTATTAIGISITSGWVVNVYAGRRLRTTGGGTTQGQDLPISSNTNNTLTLTAITTPVTSTTYAIHQPAQRGAGVELNWAFGLSDMNMIGKYMFIARGGGTVGFDRLDLTTDNWELMPTTPMMETLGASSQYSYDGGDRFYFEKDFTMNVRYLDLVTMTIHGAGIEPFIAGTTAIGNRMEIFTTVDGLKYLWTNRHAMLDMYRTLLFY